MNKTYKSGMMALSAVAFFTSCSESESLQQAHLSTDQINFIASMAHQWDANDKSAPQNPSSRSAGERDNEAPIHVNANLAKPLYLHPVVQEGIHIWSKQGTPITRSGAPIEDVEQERVVQTRGSMKNNLSAYSSFNVSAVKTEDNNESLFFGYQKTASVTSNSTTTWHVPDGINCWPVAPATLSFYAYAPTDNSMVSSGADAAGVKTVHYKATSTVTDQPDLIVSSAAESRSSNAKPAAVNLPFYHALTAVTFSVDAAMMPGTLKKVELVNVNIEGDCTMTASATPSFSWSNQKTPSTFSFDFDQPVGSSAVTLTSGDKTLMMVPQELPADAEVKFTFTVNGVSQTLSAPIGGKGKTWEAGKSIIYKLSTNAVSTISATSVSFPTTWNDIAVTSATDKVSYPKKAFDNGESIGLYVVDEAGQLVGSNIKLTKNTDGWKLDGNDKFMLLTRYKYFAYYPYSDTKAPAVNTGATNTATEFFVNTTSSLSPASVQNTKEALLAQDFQVAKGIVGSDASTLTFPMEHSMGLAVLNLTNRDIAMTRRFYTNNYTYYYPELPGHATTKPTKRTEDNKGDYTDDAAKETVSASTNFSGNIPYKIPDTNRYLQIVKPSTAISFKASDDKPRTAWGTLTPYTFNVAQNKAVSENIQTDAEFYYLARVYTCTQSVEEFTAPVAGVYKLECWGAEGGSYEQIHHPGKGGYSIGCYNILNGTEIFVCVGNCGKYGTYSYNNNLGRNLPHGMPGGGATHISINIGGELKDFTSHPNDIIIVAGGGGSTDMVAAVSTGYGGHGGGLSGTTGSNSYESGNSNGTGASSTSGGITPSLNAFSRLNGSFGLGGVGWDSSNDHGAQGGSGYFGGGGSARGGTSGGGSAYLSPLLSQSETISGNSKMPSPNGGSETTGHSGDGACVISWILK